MDSALQCLSNTLPLTDIFLSRRFLSDINKNNPLGCKGKMAGVYSDLLDRIWGNKELHNVTSDKTKGKWFVGEKDK